MLRPRRSFEIISGIVGLPRGNFRFMMDKAIILRNRKRTMFEYREHLTRIVRSIIKEGMSNGEWAVTMGCRSALLKEQFNARDREDQDDEDPDFDEKTKEWSRAMRLARHIRRPNTFRLPTCHQPADDPLSIQGSTRSNDSRTADDLLDDGSTWSNNSYDGSNEASELSVELPAPNGNSRI